MSSRVPPSREMVLAVIIVFSIAIFVCIALSSVALDKSTKSTQTTQFTTVEQDNLKLLAANTSITSNNFLASKGFTDNFISGLNENQKLLKSTVSNEPFSASQGIVNCLEVIIASSTSTDTLTIDISGINSTTLFKMLADVYIGKTLQLGSYSTSQRLLLQPQNGTIVYDSDIGTLAIFQNSAWLLLDQAIGVQSITGASGRILISGSPSTPLIDLVPTGVIAGTYTNPILQIDVYGRTTSAVSNSAAVLSVLGTSGQIDSSGGANPIISLDPTLLSSIQFWQNLQPSTSPQQDQFLQYRGSTLVWETLGSQPFPISHTIYVDISGNDSGDGSMLFPFRSIAKAIQVAQTGSNTTAINQTAILIGAGIYVETNPIAITVSGINIIGTTAGGTLIRPLTPTLDLFTMNNIMLTIQNCLFQPVTPGSSTASCVNANGQYRLTLNGTSMRYFQNAILGTGVNFTTSIAIMNYCTFGQNNNVCSFTQSAFFLSNAQVVGNLPGMAPTSSFNGVTASGINSVLTVNSGCRFIALGTAISCLQNMVAYLNGIDFSNNIMNVQGTTQSNINVISCNVGRMESGYTGFSISGASSLMNLNACTIDGLSQELVVEGLGAVVSNQATLTMSGCNVLNCQVGLQIGLTSDTASTVCSCMTSQFLNNVNTLTLNGTATFKGILLVIDNKNTMVFNSTANVDIGFSDSDIGLNIGTLTNVETNILSVATKLVNPPLFTYYPAIYSDETMAYVDPDPTSSSAFGVISTLNDAHLDIITTDLTHNAGMRLYSDLSDLSGSQIRGWHIYKNSSGQLVFEYNNNITGQPVVSANVLLRLDSVANSLFLDGSTISWVGGTDLYESSPGVLKTDTNLIIGGLTASRALVTDVNKQLTSSVVTSAELAFLSGITSSIQTQLNGMVTKNGSTMTGALNSTFAGTASIPNFAINGSGMFSSASNHLSFATNNANRLDIDSSGNVTIFSFAGNTGVVKTDVTGLLYSGLLINADIHDTTIVSTKLATQSSANNANYLVARDGSGNFQTNMITLLGNPVFATDAATKAYVDTLVGLGLSVKTPVTVVSTVNIASLSGLQTIDGVVLIDSNRVLLVAQTSAVQNGAWVAHSGAWMRPTDFSSGAQADTAYFLVTSGAINTGSSWVCSTPMAIIDTDPLTFSEFSLPQSATGNNIGTGTAIYSGAIGSVLEFRTLLGDTYITLALSVSNNEVQISSNATNNNLAGTIVARDSSGGFSAGTIIASLTGLASLNLPLTGGILTGPVTFPSSVYSAPCIIIGSTGTGLSGSAGVLNFSTGSVLTMSISSGGIVNIVSLTPVGLVHSSSAGNLSSTLLFDADITVGTIGTNKLANAASANTSNAIVVRDSSGNFSAGTVMVVLLIGNVQGNVQGTVTGHATLDVALTGSTMTGALQVPPGSAASPGLQVGDPGTGFSFSGGSLQFSTGGALVMYINSSGTLFIPGLSSGGIAHVGNLGIVTVGPIITSDIAAGAVTDTQISGVISNSKTTATAANTALTIVLRDSTGNFTAGTITATSFVGTWDGSIVAMASGGTGANLTANNGGILYSTSTTCAILNGTPTANRILVSGSSSAPSWTTATYPTTLPISQLLFTSAADTITGLTSGNNGVLITSSSGVPSWLAAGTTGQFLVATTGSTPTWSSVSVITGNLVASGYIPVSTGAQTVTNGPLLTNVFLADGTIAMTASIKMNNFAITNASFLQVANNTALASTATNTLALYATNVGGAGTSTLFSVDGTGNRNQYATVAQNANFVSNASTSTTFNLPTFSDGTGKNVIDSGIAGSLGALTAASLTWDSQTAANTSAWSSICWDSTTNVYVAVAKTASTSAAMYSADGITWTAGTTINITNGWSAVAYGSTGYDVAVSSNTTGTLVMYSINGGATWSQSGLTIPSVSFINTITGVCYAPEIDMWVAVASAGITRAMFVIGPPNVAWTLSSGVPATTWVGISWSPILRLFAAISSTASISSVMTSPDGVNWTSQTTPNINSPTWSAICWSPLLRMFVVVSSTAFTNAAMYSFDAVNWTQSTTPNTGQTWTSVCWQVSPAKFIAVANGGTAGTKMMTSENGMTWFATTILPDNTWSSIAYSPLISNRLASVGASSSTNQVMTYKRFDVTAPEIKTNALSATTPGSGISIDGALINSGALTCNQIVTNDNPWSNTSTPNSGTPTWSSINSSPTLLLAVANSGTNGLMGSTDGMNWSTFSAGATQLAGVTMTDLIYSVPLGLWCIVASNGTTSQQIWTSPTGLGATWTASTSSTPLQWQGVAFLATGQTTGIFCAVANNTSNVAVMFSATGTGTWSAGTAAIVGSPTWTKITASSSLQLFVAVSNLINTTNAIMTSPTGATWTQQTTPNHGTGGNTWHDITYGHGLFVSVSSTGTRRVMTSPNGSVWTASAANATIDDFAWFGVTWVPRPGLFCAVGTNCTMTSPDGITWTSLYVPGTWLKVSNLPLANPIVSAISSTASVNAAIYRRSNTSVRNLLIDSISQMTQGAGVDIEGVIFSAGRSISYTPTVCQTFNSGVTGIVFGNVVNQIVNLGTLTKLLDPTNEFSVTQNAGFLTYVGLPTRLFRCEIVFNNTPQAISHTFTAFICKNSSLVPQVPRIWNFGTATINAFYPNYVTNFYQLSTGDTIILGGNTDNCNMSFEDWQYIITPMY
jgi:hypothetical protein